MAEITSKDRSQYEDGGGVGKFRKKPLRRPQITPYDRPSTSLRNPNNNGWLYRKLLDPASKFITSGASRFFASMFQKRLPPPPTNQPVTEAKEESTEKNYPTSYTQNITLENSPRLQQHNIKEGENPSTRSDKNGYYELEQILKQKTFTRSEIERLTSLLKSRTLGTDNICGTNCSLADHDRKDVPDKIPMQENGIESHKLHTTPLTSIFNSKVAEEDIASPSELAKSYMGSRSLKHSPSQLSLCSQASRERTQLLSNSPFNPKSPISHVPNFGVLSNEAITPRSRGRSAIHSMARTPYSRIHPASSYKGSVTKFGSVGEPSPSSLSHFRVEGNRLSSSKQMALKRGSYVLANDIGSIGPIRRIRQKPNLLSSKSPLSGAGSVSKSQIQNGDKTTSIPSQSSEMAQKILHQLDKLVPSKDKSSSMINGQVSRSPDNVKISPIASVPDYRGPTSQKLDKVEENGPPKIITKSERSALALNGIETSASKEYTSITKFSDGLPQKKRAFQMSAPEDSLDLDNGGCTNGTANSLDEARMNVDTSLMHRKSSFTEEVKVDRTPVSSEVEPLLNSVANKNANPETFNGATQSESSMTIQPAVSVSGLDLEIKQVPQNQTSNVPPMFNIRSNNMDNVPSTIIGEEFKGMKSGTELDPKPESSTRFLFAAAADASTLKVPESDKFDKETQKADDIFRRSKATFPSVASTLSFSSPVNNLGINNGPFMSVLTSSMSSSVECTDDAQVKKKKIEMPFGHLSKPFDTTSSSVSSVAVSMASAQAPASTGPASTPFQFGSSSSIFELNGTTSVAAVNSPFGSSTPASTTVNMFSSGQSSPAPTSSLFDSNVQPVKSSLLDSTPQSAASSSAFSFATQNNNTSVLVGSSPGISTSSLYSFTQSSGNTSSSTPSTPPQPLLNSAFPFGSPSGNSDGMMSVEDTMAEDTMQASTPPISIFGLPPSASPSAGANPFQFVDKPSSGANPFVFGNQQNPFQTATSAGTNPFQLGNQQNPPQTATTSGANPFQFGNQHNPSQIATTGANLFQFGNQQSFSAASLANQSPFQAASQGVFSAGGSFSLGSGGGGDGDKSNRRIVKPRRTTRKR